ncbi:unnamed protein product, partial [Didymodactylos carnosus]
VYIENDKLLVKSSENAVTLDDVIQQCGSLSRFQYFHYFFLNLIPIVTGTINFFYVYGVAEPLYRCRLPDTIWSNDQYHPFNSTHQHLIDAWIINQDQCSIRKPLFNNLSQPSNETIACSRWVYDRSVFGRTFTEEADFVCINNIKRSLLSSALQIGAILLLLNQFLSGIDSYMIVFVLLMELTSSTHTSFAGNLALVAFTLGEIVVTLCAYLCKDWLLLKWTLSFLILLTVPYLYFIPESPYWLYSKKKYDQLEINLRQIAKTNRCDESNWFPSYQMLKKTLEIEKMPSKLSLGSKIKRLLTHSPTMLKLLISAAIGFTTMLLYMKIAYGLAAMKDTNPYVNIIMGALVESAGYLSAWLLMNKIGRKRSFLAYTLLTTACVIVIQITLKYNSIFIISVAQLGKFAISGAVCVSFIYVPELFPTTIRSGASSFFACIGRIGAIIAPTLDASLNEKHLHITTYIYALLAIIILGLTFALPETKNRPFEAKIDYTERTLKEKSTNTMN